MKCMLHCHILSAVLMWSLYMDMYKLSGHLIGCMDATSITLQDLYLLHLQGIFGIKQKNLHNVGDKGGSCLSSSQTKRPKKLLFSFEAINFCLKLHENMPLHSQVIFILHAIHACHTMSYGLINGFLVFILCRKDGPSVPQFTGLGKVLWRDWRLLAFWSLLWLMFDD